MNLFSFFKPKSALGIDIGTSALKIVQLARAGDTWKLENYGEISFLQGRAPMEAYQQNALKMSDGEIAELLSRIIAQSKATAKTAAMSLPVFSSFSTIIELPAMPKDEMEKAIQFEARQYVPIPLSEVSLDFMIIGEGRKDITPPATSPVAVVSNVSPQASPHKKKHVEVLLVAVPNEITQKYRRIAEQIGLSLAAIEIETFPLARALLPDPRVVTVIVDIGARSTDICIVDNGFVRISHNFEFSGVDITKAYAEFAKVDFLDAEKKKKMTGLNLTPGQLSGAVSLTAILDDIINETDRIMASYFNKTGRSVAAVLLAGGGANMPGMKERFAEKLPHIQVSVGNAFEHVRYPPELAHVLAERGPSLAVAVGLAMRR
ncbi:MAG: pilus assembly protein PilM [Patescibacteria group bacterium]